MSKIKVAIVDDHKMLVEGIVKMISEYDNIEIVGVAHNAGSCRSSIPFWKPDVILSSSGKGVETPVVVPLLL